MIEGYLFIKETMDGISCWNCKKEGNFSFTWL